MKAVASSLLAFLGLNRVAADRNGPLTDAAGFEHMAWPQTWLSGFNIGARVSLLIYWKLNLLLRLVGNDELYAWWAAVTSLTLTASGPGSSLSRSVLEVRLIIFVFLLMDFLLVANFYLLYIWQQQSEELVIGIDQWWYCPPVGTKESIFHRN